VRNRYFRSSPSRSRGEGFADRIEVGLHETTTIERQNSDVQRGSADLAVLSDVFAPLVSQQRLRALLAGSPGQVVSGPAATTDWIFLNVQKPPFDDRRVRQAVNFAIDRAKVVELAGGPEVGEVTCQVVPSGFPGHSPYCPYTVSPNREGRWIAPDMERARQLVAASGRAGEPVIVRVPDFREAVGRYYARVLRDLGFRTTVRVQSFDEDDTWTPGTRAQTGFVGWAADYLAASTFIRTAFTCRQRDGFNLSRICDRALDGRIDRAIATLPSESAGAWAAAEHRVSDLAPVVPLTRRRSAVLVSKRVGNVRTHGQWFTLLDQMWVR
jgi:peptide/nickel transport system substrate-binding protein